MLASSPRILLACASFLLSWQLSASFSLAVFTEHGATVLGGLNVSGRSASLADIDGDGDLDLFFQGGGSSSQKLLLNNVIGTGNLTFTDITSTFLPTPTLEDSWSAAWGDYDGDGRIDVFVGQDNSTNAAGVSLGYDKGDVFKNNWPNAFTNTSVATGLNDAEFHQNEAWVDIDNDRDLDLIIAMEGPAKHQIYLQGPASNFTPVGAAVGFQQDFGWKAYGMAIGDTDDDGDLDVYISTCRLDNNIRNNFYENQLVETGSLSFIDIADTNGTQNMRNSYGAEFLDFDNDGKLDLFVVGSDGERSKIYRNDGNNSFTDVDTLTGQPLLSDPAGDLNGGRAVDYDNDGDLDLYFHNNAAGSKARKLYRNNLVENGNNWSFTDVTLSQGINASIEGGYDSAWGDLDLDGDQDLIVPNNIGPISGPFPERVFLSDAAENGNHWLYVRLNGPTDNTTGIGASLYATLFEGTPEEVTLRREANTNAGTFNQSDLPVHFGLGSATVIDELRIRWPDGTMQHLYDVPTDQYPTVTIAGPGDFDGDGDVDGRDFLAWQRGESSDPFSPTDLAEWQAHFNAPLGALSEVVTEVPEPACLWIAGVLLCLVRRRRSF